MSARLEGHSTVHCATEWRWRRREWSDARSAGRDGGGEKQKEEKRGRSEHVFLKPHSYVSGGIDFEWWDLQLKSASNFCKPNHCQGFLGFDLLIRTTARYSGFTIYLNMWGFEFVLYGLCTGVLLPHCKRPIFRFAAEDFAVLTRWLHGTNCWKRNNWLQILAHTKLLADPSRKISSQNRSCDQLQLGLLLR